MASFKGSGVIFFPRVWGLEIPPPFPPLRQRSITVSAANYETKTYQTRRSAPRRAPQHCAHLLAE